MGYKSKFLLMPIIFLLFILSNVQAASVEITRDMPESFIPGKEATVRLHMVVDERRLPAALGIEETIPEGWQVTDLSLEEYSKYDKDANVVGWVFWQGGNEVRDAVLNYTVIPNSSYGEFSGVWISSDKEGTVVSICTPGWKCKNSNHRAYQNSNCEWEQEKYCFLGCGDGKCLTCVDSDGGVNPFVYGVCRDKRGAFPDRCFDERGGDPKDYGAYVLEGFCLTDEMIEHCKRYNSPDYCENLPRNCYRATLLPFTKLVRSYFSPDFNTMICPFGCSGGVCITETQEAVLEFQTLSDIKPGETNSFDFQRSSGLDLINLSIPHSIEDTMLAILAEESSEKPDYTPRLSEDIEEYLYIEINSSNALDDIQNVNIVFKVNKTWLSEKGISKNNVLIYKYNKSTNEWDKIQHTISGEDQENVYYSINTHFSSELYFIGGLITGAGSAVGSAPGFELHLVTAIITIVFVSFLMLIRRIEYNEK